MTERERPEPFDLSEQFLASKNNLRSFSEQLKSLQGAPIRIAIDLADVPSYIDLTNFMLRHRKQIDSFAIRATEEEKKKHQALFFIAGVKWERKK